MTEQIIFLGLVVFASHMVEGITGFGCMILALPFAAGLLGLQTLTWCWCCAGAVA